MNRLVAVGLLADAVRGKHVLTVTEGPARLAMALVEEVAEAMCPGDVERVVRAHGHEEIRFTNGGRLSFRSRRTGLRGYSADTLYMDGAFTASEALMAEVRPVAPEVIRP